jgi:23S rRNA pseudouridine2457 synthase
MIILFNKPFNVLCQFTDKVGRKTLSDFIPYKDVYPAGRLDYDSEGLVILTDEGKVQSRVSDPKYKIVKKYWVQVEGIPSESAINKIRKGVLLKDGITKPAEIKLIDSPNIWDRFPPIRERKSIPTSWLELSITEGRNRQVRRMTSAVGYPTLRLIRYSIDNWNISALKIGDYKVTNNSSSL